MTSYFRSVIFCCALTIAAQAQTVYSVSNIFRPFATPAKEVYSLSLLVFAVCGAIFSVVAGLLTYTLIRFRRRGKDNREPAQVYGSDRIEIAWTVIPILVVFVLTMATARIVSAIQGKTVPTSALQAVVVGHQWWWEIRYPALGIVTANELHVPVSSQIDPQITSIRLDSADVAHSFWVPQLAGKTDLIPNHSNRMWIDPQQEGVFVGNCAEYCGTQHANMLLRVVVDSNAAFAQWVSSQQQPALSSAEVAAGRKDFLDLSCMNCHTVSGTRARGTFGPDLSHLMSRNTLGAGVVFNNPENLRAWVKDPQAAKPGCLMPDMQLTPQQLNDLVSYLSSLK